MAMLQGVERGGEAVGRHLIGPRTIEIHPGQGGIISSRDRRRVDSLFTAETGDERVAVVLHTEHSGAAALLVPLRDYETLDLVAEGAKRLSEIGVRRVNVHAANLDTASPSSKIRDRHQEIVDGLAETLARNGLRITGEIQTLDVASALFVGVGVGVQPIRVEGNVSDRNRGTIIFQESISAFAHKHNPQVTPANRWGHLPLL